MKKRLLSILLMCCMVLTLLPTTAFAEGSTEESLVCTCETACTAESMNADCPVCGAEDASAENCAKYVKPADDVPTQPEGEPVTLNDEIETLAAATEVSTAEQLKNAVSASGSGDIKLMNNITINGRLEIDRTVMLDLNNYELNATEILIGYNATSYVEFAATGGTIDIQVNNTAAGIIRDGTFSGIVSNQNLISGGTFRGKVANCNYVSFGQINFTEARITGGDFYGEVTNGPVNEGNGSGTIIGGSFYGKVTNTGFSMITGGDFYDEVVSNAQRYLWNGIPYGYITGGTFYDGLTDNSTGEGSVQTWTVTYMSFGSEYAKQVVSSGSTLTAPKDPTKDYYQFVEWRTADGKAYDFNTAVTEDITLTAQWSTGLTGEGTAEAPYQLSSKDDLKLFRDMVNSGEYGLCAVLTKNIDLNNENWTPIGNTTYNDGTGAYSGTFDGKGHTISGLNVTDSHEFAGLFGVVSHNGTIKNLTVAGKVSSSSSQCKAGGIVGYASNAVINNCSNHCSVSGGDSSYVGGIAGCNVDGARIIDCYNVGTIKNCSDYSPLAVGGIAGQNNDTISNCYNVGTVSNSDRVGEIVGYNFATVENCYYLDGTGLNAVGNGSTKDNVTKTEAKSETEFADGTVLAMLINGRTDSPWDSTCKYVTAAGKTLPVFKGQGDAHSHVWGAWTSNGDGTHTRACACGVTETGKCSGGTATCTAKAKCADCGAEYGDTNPNHHGDKLKHVEAKDATTSEEGNIEYWYCEACEKYFSDADAKNEITQAQTVIPKRQSSGSNYSYYTIKATAGAGGSISPSGNVSVREGRDQTFTITPDKGYAVSNVKIDGKSIGAVKSYTFENVSRTHTIEVIFMKANGNPQTGVFVDVATGSYYEDAVDWAVENGITQGTNDTHFSPDGICTRAQAVTFLWRTAGSPEPETRTMPFTDVPAGSYYYDAVLWAVENGITKGTSDTTFSPDATCSRAQIVTFLWRSEKSPAAGTANPFADVKSTAYYADAVLWAVKEDITKGTTNTTFSPDADCTRAQIVTFLWRCKK